MRSIIHLLLALCVGSFLALGVILINQWPQCSGGLAGAIILQGASIILMIALLDMRGGFK